MLLAAPLGKLPFFNFGSKTSKYPLKVHIFKQIQGAKHKNRFFFGKNVFFIAYIMFKKIKSYAKKYCPALMVENNFLEFHTGI